jgi:glycosyltransferase involved in cell wall biosynthesis
MWRVVVIFLVALAGFWMGKGPQAHKGSPLIAKVYPEKEFPISEHKSFVVVIYAHNQAHWCQRALRSVFEQDYDHYRVIVIDDGSIDNTGDKAKQFIVENNQDEKVIFMRNETRYGEVASLYRAIDSCLDKEIVIPLNAKDWLASPIVLNRLNIAYQNPDVWISFAQTIDYPSYAIREGSQVSYYAILFKQLRLNDLFANGRFVSNSESYLGPLQDLAGGRTRKLREPVAFSNRAPSLRKEEAPTEISKYSPLATFPAPKGPKHADILLFSYDRPLQLYATLESIQRYITGFEHLTVLYRASNEAFADGYEKVKDAFPIARFVTQFEGDFKPKLEKIVFNSPSQYILFGADDLIVKDFVDLKQCMDQMEKTGAYGFYLRFGRHIHSSCLSNQPQPLPPSQPLSGGIYAWDIAMGEDDWGFAPSLDMTLFKKDQIKKVLSQTKYKNPNGLETSWLKEVPENALGLYFERSKMVNISNYLNTEELLVKFNQGLKIDIEPLYKVENGSPHLDYIPEFVLR